MFIEDYGWVFASTIFSNGSQKKALTSLNQIPNYAIGSTSLAIFKNSKCRLEIWYGSVTIFDKSGHPKDDMNYVGKNLSQNIHDVLRRLQKKNIIQLPEEVFCS